MTLNAQEADQLLATITAEWPTWSSPTRVAALAENLYETGYDYEKCRLGIKDLVLTWRGRSEPKTADIIYHITQAVVPVQYTAGKCKACQGTDWLFLDHNTVEQCGCGGYQDTPNHSSGYTLDGSPVATPQQKHAAIIRGYKKFNPKHTKEELVEHLKKFGLKETLDSVDNEPF